MQPPDEIMVERFLPALRALVSRKLVGEGFTQSQVSNMLGVTQASVSNYSSTDPSRAYESLRALEVSREDAEAYADLISEELKHDPIDAVETLRSVWTELLGRGSVCGLHRQMYPSLADCDVCIQAYGRKGDPRSRAISDVAEGAKILEASGAFPSVMPEVSVNLACMTDSAIDPSGVVAIPGRMVKVKGRARALQDPEFGASKHLANVLLLVKKRRPDVGACINIRYDGKMSRILRRMGVRVLELPTHSASRAGDPTVEAIRDRLAALTGEFDAIEDPGGKGIEPNLYLFGESAVEVSKLAVQISEKYSAG